MSENNYDYENGEEYMETIDPDFADLADAAYEKINAEMPEDVKMPWYKISTQYFSIEVPEKSDKGNWSLYIGARNAMLNAVNQRAENYGVLWRLFIETPGESLIKATESTMVARLLEKRFKRVAGAFRTNLRQFTPLLTLELPEHDKKLIQQAIDISNGANIMIGGSVDRLKSLSGGTKQKLLGYFGLGE